MEQPRQQPAPGPVRAVVFDLDGVIVDSEALNVRSARVAFGEAGHPLDDADRALIVGRHPDDYVPELAARFSMSAASVARVRAAQESLYRTWREDDASLLVPGAADVPGAVRARGLATGLVTSSGREHALGCLGRARLLEQFDVIVTGDDVAARKPDPEPYRVSSERLGLEPAALLVAEDSVHGVRSAVAAGARCVGVASRWTAAPTLLEAGAERVLPALSDLLELLGGAGNGSPGAG